MGPVLIFATLFNFVEKLAGTSGGWLEELEGMGWMMSGGLVMVSKGMVTRVSLSPVEDLVG